MAEGGPSRVGIRGIISYFPHNVVLQRELEEFDGVSKGKYTIGLGQDAMGFCADNEDVVSIALTVTQALLHTYQVDPNTVGFLAVGTETLIDKSKSVKTELMRLFPDNADIEGVDEKNACFGGTQAVLHAHDWIIANWSTERRFAIAVLADIAIYEKGPARCTGGAGAMAILIGPDAPIVFERGLRAFHMSASWDFYKPIGDKSSEYPMVDGENSLRAYMNALEGCYATLRAKTKRLTDEDVWMGAFTAAFFHSPFTSLVQKAVGRLIFQDFLKGKTFNGCNKEGLQELADRYKADPSVIENEKKILKENGACFWNAKVSPFLEMNRRIGNMYTPSVFVQLITFLARSENLNDARTLFFAYGSGSASAMFTARIQRDQNGLLEQMIQTSREALKRLDERRVFSPEAYTEALNMRERFLHTNREFTRRTYLSAPLVPVALSKDEFDLFPGTFYLTSMNEKYHRKYTRFPELQNGHAH